MVCRLDCTLSLLLVKSEYQCLLDVLVSYIIVYITVTMCHFSYVRSTILVLVRCFVKGEQSFTIGNGTIAAIFLHFSY